jgi:hypothetical protein
MGKTLPPLPRAPKPNFVPPKIDWQSGGEGSEVFYSMSGMEALQANLDTLPIACQDAAGVEMQKIAMEIIEEARDTYVPYKYGALRDSAGYDEYEVGKGIKVTEIGMWFGAPGGGSPAGEAIAIHENLTVKDPSLYAEDQHSNTSYNHPIVGPVTAPSAKYLEIPFTLKQPEVAERIARAIDDMGGPNLRDMPGMEPLL